MARPKAKFRSTNRDATIHQVTWLDNQTNSTISMEIRTKRPINFGFGDGHYDSDLEGEDRAIQEAVQLAIRFILAARV